MQKQLRQPHLRPFLIAGLDLTNRHIGQAILGISLVVRIIVIRNSPDMLPLCNLIVTIKPTLPTSWLGACPTYTRANSAIWCGWQCLSFKLSDIERA